MIQKRMLVVAAVTMLTMTTGAVAAVPWGSFGVRLVRSTSDAGPQMAFEQELLQGSKCESIREILHDNGRFGLTQRQADFFLDRTAQEDAWMVSLKLSGLGGTLTLDTGSERIGLIFKQHQVQLEDGRSCVIDRARCWNQSGYLLSLLFEKEAELQELGAQSIEERARLECLVEISRLFRMFLGGDV